MTMMIEGARTVGIINSVFTANGRDTGRVVGNDGVSGIE